MTPYGIAELWHHWFRKRSVFIICSAPNHCLNQCCLIAPYSGVPNSQTRLTINAVEKIPGAPLYVAIDIVQNRCSTIRFFIGDHWIPSQWRTSNTGDPLHSRALAPSRAPLFTQPCPHCWHSRAPGEQWARLCIFTLQGCVQAARLYRGSPVSNSESISVSSRHHIFSDRPHYGPCPRAPRGPWLQVILRSWPSRSQFPLVTNMNAASTPTSQRAQRTPTPPNGWHNCHYRNHTRYAPPVCFRWTQSANTIHVCLYSSLRHERSKSWQ